MFLFRDNAQILEHLQVLLGKAVDLLDLALFVVGHDRVVPKQHNIADKHRHATLARKLGVGLCGLQVLREALHAPVLIHVQPQVGLVPVVREGDVLDVAADERLKLIQQCLGLIKVVLRHMAFGCDDEHGLLLGGGGGRDTSVGFGFSGLACWHIVHGCCKFCVS